MKSIERTNNRMLRYGKEQQTNEQKPPDKQRDQLITNKSTIKQTNKQQRQQILQQQAIKTTSNLAI